MKIKILLITLFISVLSYGQYQKYTRKHYRLFINGKALAGPTSTENKYGKSITIGAGITFLKDHSLSTDYVFFENNYEHESLSPAGYYNNNGTYDVTYRKYLIFSYRYIFAKKTPGIYPYFGAFMKLGKENRLFDDGIIPRESTPLNYRADINEYGVVIGFKLNFGSNERVGLDFNVGAVNAYHYILYGKKHSPWNNGEYVTNYLDSFWKPNIRLNLYFNLFKIE